MKLFVTLSIFMEYFKARNDTRDSFSYFGLKALYEYLDQYDDDNETETEFCPVDIACQYSQYDDLEELQTEYDIESMDRLSEKTIIIDIPEEGFIIQPW